MTQTPQNAPLIEALEQLLAVAVRLDQSATHEGLENCQAIANARAALAKAKGGV